jgi:chromosome segregation ATPase
MIDSDLLNELERKDLIIKNLQKQLKENITYLKTDPYFNSSDQLKNEIMRKDSEISYLASKISSIQNENNALSKKISHIQQEYFDYKLKSTNEIQKLNEIIKSNSLSINNYKNINEKMKQELSKISSDNSNILQNNENMNSKINEYENNIYNYESDNNRLQGEVQLWKEKYMANEVELKEAKYKYEQFSKDLKTINENLKQFKKENSDMKNYINRILSDLTYWFKESDFLMLKFPKLLYDNSNINGIDFSQFYDAIISLQDRVNAIVSMQKEKLTP